MKHPAKFDFDFHRQVEYENFNSYFVRQVEYERHQKEHKIIDQFQGNVEKCREAEVKFHGEELKIYGERMTVLQKAYNELLVLSNKRVSDLHSLYDFMQVYTLKIFLQHCGAELLICWLFLLNRSRFVGHFLSGAEADISPLGAGAGKYRLAPQR